MASSTGVGTLSSGPDELSPLTTQNAAKQSGKRGVDISIPVDQSASSGPARRSVDILIPVNQGTSSQPVNKGLNILI
ncbi:MAG: hypothetical protein P4N59_03125 [Negativicutes bacterium]|nr:hypothetical protein [Negativicutes bacterium]